MNVFLVKGLFAPMSLSQVSTTVSEFAVQEPDASEPDVVLANNTTCGFFEHVKEVKQMV